MQMIEKTAVKAETLAKLMTASQRAHKGMADTLKSELKYRGLAGLIGGAAGGGALGAAGGYYAGKKAGKKEQEKKAMLMIEKIAADGLAKARHAARSYAAKGQHGKAKSIIQRVSQASGKQVRMKKGGVVYS